ncbi:MAG: DUF1552 domain-containing protein [Verrucomicrobiales bacterium]|nr:DUF1552 domain-containing protein [Verrucomicrobiales bacterium]
MKHSTRRSFLGSSSTILALPFLESLGFSRFSKAADLPVPAKRMVFLSVGWGVTRETWFPDKKQTGTDYDLPKGLAPLSKYKEDITVIQNLQHRFSNEAHWGSTFWLTGANRYGVPGQSFHNTVSADQVAAEHLGRETRFTSIQLNGKKAEGHGPGLSLAWNQQGKPVPGLDTPVELYHRLFSDETTPMEQRQAMLKQKRSVLDTVLEDARSVQKGLTSTDKDKLNEYFQSIREIEVRLAKEEEWLEVPKRLPQTPVKEPAAGLKGYEEIKMMYDLMIAAMQVDSSRVFTYRMPTDSLISSLGATISSHNMSHYTSGERQEVSEMRDQSHAKLLAHFIGKLKSSREADGSSLYDNTAVTFGSNINSIHHLNNCPTLLTGGGAGIRHGRHLVMDDPKTPLCNLWLSLLNGSGINVESHGDSTGKIDQLFA